MNKVAFGPFRFRIVGTGNITDDDGTPRGRGILVELGGADGRAHKFFLDAVEAGIAALEFTVGQEFSADVVVYEMPMKKTF